MNLGDSRRITMAGGYMAAAIGAGHLDQSTPILSMGRRLLAGWAGLDLDLDSALVGSRLVGVSRSIRGITADGATTAASTYTMLTSTTSTAGRAATAASTTPMRITRTR
jgi:hypothetical protein